LGFRFPNVLQRGVRHRLDPARIIATAENLAHEIGGRLPGSNLAGLAAELVQVAHGAEERASRAHRPIYAVRAASVLAIVACGGLLWAIGRHVHARWEFSTITEVFEAADAGFNLVAILAGALWFLASFEARIKRRLVLESLEELREFVHVIDVTQLYYTPDLNRAEGPAAPGHRRLDHTYLLDCTRMLAVIGNLAPIYARGATGDTVLRAASDVEMLANAISMKLQAKAEEVRLGRTMMEG
jgi:hypothetical protein